MAETDSPSTPKRHGRDLKHRYVPTQHRPSAQALKTRGDLCCDYFIGTRAQLIEAGVVPNRMFPGDPGMPMGYVTMWPPHAVRGPGNWCVPGKLSVTRLPSGKFTATLFVAEQEQERREAVHKADAERRQQESEARKQREAAEVRAVSASAASPMSIGAGYPNRTDDLPLTRRVLYQLS